MSDAPTSHTRAADDPDRHHRGLGRAVRTVSGLTLASRVAGLARDVLTARIFGDTAVGSAFAAAFAIPNLFRRLFGEGALSAAFLPVYTRLSDTDTRAAGSLASLTVALLALVTGVLTILIELGLLALLWTLPADADRDLSLGLIMVLVPFMPLVCVAAILGGMLQSHGRFGPWAAAPILLNACILAAATPAFFVPGVRTETWAYAIAAAAVLSGVLQVLWSARALRSLVAWTRDFSRARTEAGAMFRRMVPALIGLGTLQLNSFLDTLVAMWPNWIGPTMFGRPYPLDEASNSILFYAQRLYQFPLGVFGIAVATAAFPALSRAAGDPSAFASVLKRGIRLSLFIGIPASVGLALVREDLCRVLLSGPGGGFSDEGVGRASLALMAYGSAVWAYSLNQVLTRAFYARGDTTTPMRVALAMILLNCALNFTLIWSLREAGIAWATAASATGQTALLWWCARRRTGPGSLWDGGVARSLAGTAASTAAMAAAVLGVLALLGVAGWGDAVLRLVFTTGAGAAVYGGTALLLRRPELRWLASRA